MWIQREIERIWTQTHSLPVRVLLGPRQTGKSSLLKRLGGENRRWVSLDDLQIRNLAQRDPALLFDQFPWPLTIDEAQYAPLIFPEIKKRIDLLRYEKTLDRPSPLLEQSPVWIAGSNLTLMDREVKESLAGRASYLRLHTLSVSELLPLSETSPVARMLLLGGWPELWSNPKLDPVRYLNDYVQTFLEKDIAQAAGIQKIQSFTQALQLLAGRVGQLLNASEVGQNCGVGSTTIQDWIGTLEQNLIVSRLLPFHTNLSKRLIKTPKIYFLDTGLASRLQGWTEHDPILRGPQAGHLFENLVYSEIVKFIDHHLKPWNLYFIRTKEQEEVDFVIQINPERFVLLDAKLAIQNLQAVDVPKEIRKTLNDSHNIVLVSFGGERKRLSKTCEQIPIHRLKDYLQEL